ncbi:MAG: peptidoglycan DD-metalloendopeptidase family protein [Candidatus Andersenbacteria bacterium]|nr:peptidoglycan DD-metalloendopeptidase family protein [Candidatus Andersenbacteria bacterium]MBI3251266.1 peptidoglycan DD-metalloendopeptidase family protein [Candidatus Andersenbacteria bacterium]
MSGQSVYPTPPQLLLPVTPYQVTGRTFGQRVRSRVVLWARHLGDDVVLSIGTPVHAIADGSVVWSEVRPGSEDHRNWGGIIVLAHQDKRNGEAFFSLYGHITNLTVKEGADVTAGQTLGVVAPGSSPENGWWKTPHVHFGIYAGPWMSQILPGYARPFDGRTKFNWWRSPLPFINEYNKTENG